MEEDGLGKELDSMCDFSKAVLEKGIEKGKNEIVAEMLTEKLPLALIEKISKLTEEAILAIADSLGIDVVR